MSAYIPTNVISITDGPDLPAVDLFNADRVRRNRRGYFRVPSVNCRPAQGDEGHGTARLTLAGTSVIPSRCSPPTWMRRPNRQLTHGEILLMLSGQSTPTPWKTKVASIWMGTNGCRYISQFLARRKVSILRTHVWPVLEMALYKDEGRN